MKNVDSVDQRSDYTQTQTHGLHSPQNLLVSSSVRRELTGDDKNQIWC